MLKDSHSPSSRSIPADNSLPKPDIEAASGSSPVLDPHSLAVSLLKQEYKKAYVELARSGSGVQLYSGGGDAAKGSSMLVRRMLHTETGATLPGRRVPLREEMPSAVRAYDFAVACMREAMASAGQGRFQGGAASDAALGLVESLERNIDALLCLPRMQQRDDYMYTHGVNVATLLAAYAMVSGKPRRKVLIYALAGLFHDIGKVLLPAALLNARRQLSITEQTLVMRHPMLSCDLLATLPDLHSEVIMAALEHHERYDGSGYPKGLSGDAISDVGHLAAVADSYDALSSHRPYKGPLFPHKTLGVLYQMRQKQFHSETVEKFVRMVGIYPVGSIVELKDGYRGVVTASNYTNPMLPLVTLALDPQGTAMCPHECDMATEAVSGIARCLPPEGSGIDPCRALGIVL